MQRARRAGLVDSPTPTDPTRAPCQNRTDDLFLTKEVRYHCAKGASLFF